ncbi:S-adenosyl-L-methionine-dependent methyltransferase [Fusarium oxysporum]|nr:S-adenosyl-L-methionine-dependent methyltransferase [Fusarium oxysporum]
MSIYGWATFSAAGLFKTILGYYHHEDPHGTLLDLGSGHGIVARELSPRFARAIAIDPSAGMMQQGMQATAQFSKISFRQGSAEDLSFLPAHSVDMAVAGESAHWVVKSGGSLAFWGYKDNIIIGHPQANKIFERFCYGEGDVSPGLEGLNQYWERPARDILRGLLADVKPPESDWDKIKRITYNVDKDTTEIADAETAWMRSKINPGQFEAYVRAFTAYRGWMDAHPDKKSRAEGGAGDIVDILFDQILEAEPEWKAQGDLWRDIEVESVWGSYILLAKRK